MTKATKSSKQPTGPHRERTNAEKRLSPVTIAVIRPPTEVGAEVTATDPGVATAFLRRSGPSQRTNRVGRGLSLNRSQCGGCSTKYDTPSLKSSGLRAIPRLTLHGGFETRRQRQNPASCGCQVGWPVRARRRGCDDSSTARGRRANPPPTADHRRHWRRRPLWQAPAERKETPFVIPWRHRSRFRLRGFQPLSRGGSLAPSLVRASTRTVAPIPRFLSYWTG